MFGHNQWTERFKRIHQMPVPVMQIDTNILTEVPQSMLDLIVRCCVAFWDFNWFAQTVGHDEGLFAYSSEYFAIQIFLGKRFDEQWNR